MVVLQNSVDLLKGKRGSSNETCVTSVVDGSEVIGIEAEMVSSMTEEEDRGPRTIPVIKTEPEVSAMLVVSVRYVSYKLYLHLPEPV
jgi:predicted nucleotidyltransferase